MKVLFSAAVLLNAGLIFWVELLFGKRLLPALGGSPAVWNTCLMFYQVALLAGYGYVVALDRLRPSRQFAVHALVLAVTVVLVPWSLFLWPDPAGARPVTWLLGLLTVSVGPPFFALAAGTPLLQRWFSHTGHPEGGDPYFLYAASNLGSFIALAAYPLALEPLLTLDQQSVLWKASFVAVGGLVLASGAAMLRHRARSSPAAAPGPEPSTISPDRRARWVLLAFVPSSLLLGVTTHVTSEIAPVPLLWVVPLGLYLLTFVVAFGPARHESGERSSGRRSRGAGRASLLLLWVAGASALLLVALAILRGSFREIGWLLIAGDLAVLGAAGLVCHGRLARDRPEPARLAEFYLWVALGGALGGVFNTLVAPVVFTDPLEYPLVLALFAFVAGSVRGAPGNEAPMDAAPADGPQVMRAPMRARPEDLALGLLPGAVALGAAWIGPRFGLDARLLLPLAGIACLAVAGRPIRFGLGVAGLVLVGFTLPVRSGVVVFKERTFYGIHRVYWDEAHLWLAHGTTVHGGQNALEPGVPLTYYHPDGPAGSLFRSFYGRGSDPGAARVAVVGLGTGSLVGYARPGQSWTFYELDPTVVRVAEDPLYFTFLRDTFARYRTVVGDARLALEREEETFDLIVVDAFSSDAIPVHLLTEEAIDLYRRRLRPSGWIAFHTSNRYADFSDVLANLAAATGLAAYEGADRVGDDRAGRYPSRWVLLTASPVEIDDPRWQPLPPSGGRVWTDAYSSLFEVLR